MKTYILFFLLNLSFQSCTVDPDHANLFRFEISHNIAFPSDIDVEYFNPSSESADNPNDTDSHDFLLMTKIGATYNLVNMSFFPKLDFRLGTSQFCLFQGPMTDTTEIDAQLALKEVYIAYSLHPLDITLPGNQLRLFNFSVPANTTSWKTQPISAILSRISATTANLYRVASFDRSYEFTHPSGYSSYLTTITTNLLRQPINHNNKLDVKHCTRFINSLTQDKLVCLAHLVETPLFN